MCLPGCMAPHPPPSVPARPRRVVPARNVRSESFDMTSIIERTRVRCAARTLARTSAAVALTLFAPGGVSILPRNNALSRWRMHACSRN